MKCTLLNFSFKDGFKKDGDPWKMVRAEILFLDEHGKNRTANILVFESKPGAFNVLKDGGKYELLFSLRRNKEGRTEPVIAGFVVL